MPRRGMKLTEAMLVQVRCDDAQVVRQRRLHLVAAILGRSTADGWKIATTSGQARQSAAAFRNALSDFTSLTFPLSG